MENSEPPFLSISHGESNQSLSYNFLENELRSLDSSNILCGKVVMASSHGWLVLADFTTDDCCLWNPTSEETIELPQLQYVHVYSTCVLSKPPTESDCHVLFNTTARFEQAFCRIGDEEFAMTPIQRHEDGGVHKLRAVGSFKGMMYGLTGPDNLFVTIHFVGKTIEYRPIMKVDEPWSIPELAPKFSTIYNMTWLIQSSPESKLLLVQKTYSCRYLKDGLDYKVFQFDTEEMTCVELDSIGERAIFVSYHGTGFCCNSSEKIKANSIYYTDQYGGDLYVFELQDSSTTSVLSSRLAHRHSVSSWYQLFS